MSADTVKCQPADSVVPDVSDAPVTKEQKPRLSQLLPLIEGFCQLRVLEPGYSMCDYVTMNAPSGRALLEKIQRSEALDRKILLNLVPKLTTNNDYLLISVRLPKKEKFTGVDYSAELKELMDAVMEYNSDRDMEWDFVDKHGLNGNEWTDEQAEEHEQILADIKLNRVRIQNILRRVTGNVTLEF